MYNGQHTHTQRRIRILYVQLNTQSKTHTHTHAHAHTYAHLYMYVCIIRSYLEMLQSRRRRHPPTTTAAPRSDRMPTDQRLTGAGGSGELQRRSLAEKKEVEEVERGSAACPCPASCAYLGLGCCCWCCNSHISARWVGGRWPEMGGVVCISERASSSYVCVCVCVRGERIRCLDLPIIMCVI